MLNGNALLFEMLSVHAKEVGCLLQADIDTTSIDKMPLATFTGRAGAALNDRGTVRPLAWGWTLDMSFFTPDEEACHDLAASFYDYVHSWNRGSLFVPPGEVVTGIVPGVGHAENVSDRSLPSKVAVSTIPGHRIAQYSGGWDLQLHQA